MWLKTAMMVGQMLSALGVIGLVLIQQGKGADMGTGLGSGSSGSLFGPTGSANFLSRTTAVLAILFFACTLTLTFLGSRKAPISAGVLGASQPATSSSPASSTALPKPEQAQTNEQDIPK